MTGPVVLPDAAAVAGEVARRFRQSCLAAVAERGRFLVALSGGSTPRAAYEQVALLEGIPWPAVQVFFGDERCVPAGDGDSNYRMAAEALLFRVPLPEENVHRVMTELGCREAAADYAAQLRAVLGPDGVFDLVHLGLGPDGHVASLFPATDLERPEAVLVTQPTSGLKPAVERVTLSLAVLMAAREIILMVTGESKAKVLSDTVLARTDTPSVRIMQAQPILIVDAPAASLIA